MLPYEQNQKAGGIGTALQDELDSITKPYVYQGDYAIRTATLLQVGDGELTRDLSKEEIADVFTFAELLAFAGLSNREFFSVIGISYTNRDAFRVAIEQYRRTTGFTTVVTRRRDGSTFTAIDEKNYRVHKPRYVKSPETGIDVPLLHALLDAQAKLSDKQWLGFYEALVNFNLANTDNDQISPEIEVVFSIAAFERLLGLSSGRDSALASSFAECTKATVEPTLTKCSRFSNPKFSKQATNRSVRETWIRDMLKVRGNAAHGKRTSAYPSMWSTEEHLLLSSYVFPLCLKRRLSQVGFYQLTKEDEFRLFTFEKLAATNLNVRCEDGQDHPWNRVVGDATFEFPGGLAEELQMLYAKTTQHTLFQCPINNGYDA